MIARYRQMLRPAAAPEVEPMRPVTCLKSLVHQAAGVARVARSFESVHQDQLAASLGRRTLRVHQNLHAGLRLIDHRFHGPSLLAAGTAPEASRNGRQVSVLEERMEGAQALFYDP